MKKIVLGALLLAAPALSMAGTGPGCGLGAVIFEGQTGLMPHVLAATTNGTAGNQTFGMTSGTLGCDTNQKVIASASDFVNNNVDRLAQDMSRGEGEMLNTLSSLMGVDAADRNAFNAFVKAHFDTLYPSSAVNGDQVLATLVDLMKKDAVLAKYAA